jgi:hypothetical protein
LHATFQVIKKLAMTTRYPANDQWINVFPGELCSACSELTPLLPHKVSLWGLNLVAQFHDAISFDLQELILSCTSYSAANLFTFITCSSQLAALCSIQVAAAHHFVLFLAQEKLIAKTVNPKMKQLPSALAAPMSVTTAAAPFLRPKLWRPDPINRCVPMDHSNDIENGIFPLFQQHCHAICHAICHPPTSFSDACTDIHLWDSERDLPKFTKNFVVGPALDPAIDPALDPATRSAIVAIIELHWDCFCSAGVQFPIFYFEFAMDRVVPLLSAAKSPIMGPTKAKS